MILNPDIQVSVCYLTFLYFQELPSNNIKLFETKRDKFKARVARKRKLSESVKVLENQEVEQSDAFKVCKKYQARD